MRINDNPQRIHENLWDKYVAEKTKGIFYILEK